MSLLRPKKLVLQGFRSFREHTEINFPDSGAVMISGHHTDGTTGSGTGKSSVLLGLYFALGVCDIPQTELKNWHSKSMLVTLTLTDGVNTYEITRDPKLKLVQNGIAYSGTSEGAEELLKELLKVTPELVTPLTYRPQRSEGKFINQTDAKNKEFLSDILGLSQVETANDSFSKELSTINSRIQIVTANLSNLKINLSTMNITDEVFVAAKESYSKACENVNQLSLSSDKIAELSQELSKMDAEQAKLNRVVLEVNMAQQENSSIRNKIQQTKNDLDVLNQKICHTCRREWSQSQDLADQKQKEIDALLERMPIQC